MKVKELFQKDPTSWRLANEGVSSNNSADVETLKYELRTFVCDGEYHSGLAKILRGYLDNLGKEQKAAWVSGFYGSGKSHLVKVLRYLWTDHSFGNGETARTITTLPDDIVELLKELSTQGKRGHGLHSAGGTLKAGTGTVRLRTLGIILQSKGLPEKISIARLRLDLLEDGKLEAVESAIRAQRKDPAEEFDRPYTSAAFQKAYLASYPHLGDTKSVSQALLGDYPAKVDDISIDDMLKVVRRALGQGKKLPCTVVVLDEVQQFINNDHNIALEVQEVVEACSKGLDGKVLFVGTGQSALTDTASLQKLMGRFTIKVHLKDNDVEKVVRTVVLRKKEEKKKVIDDFVSKHSGEITRQLKGTKLATRSEDDRAYVPDYPILPVRARFWERVLHSVDPSGTTAQMRTQLRVAHEACRSVAERELGAVIPADFIYDQLANDLVMSGEMQKRFQEIIDEQKTKRDGDLRRRVCGLVFLINKLPRNGADTGVRANTEHLADLLTEDMGASASTIREKIPGLIESLRTEGVLMEVDGEYRLQTPEGAAWEAEYRRRRSSLLNNEAQIAAQRSQSLSKALLQHLSGISHPQGAAKVARKAIVHHGSDKPKNVEELTVWVRDGFQESESSILQDIQRLSVEDATIHVLVPKAKADELKQAFASWLAAEQTCNYMGDPTAQEGKEARASMLSRQAGEGARADGLIGEVVAGARVFLSGGQELAGEDLRTTVLSAATNVLQRLYPKFDMGDSGSWSTVFKKAKEGNASALTVLGYQGDPDKHPVAVEVLQFIGAGKRGTDIISHFTSPPYGWPKDALDGTLAVLMQSGHLSGRLQGQPAKLAELDQRKIGQSEFRLQHPVLSPAQRLKVRRLFMDAGYSFTPGDEQGAAPGFIQHLRELARAAGGVPPAPEAPHAPEVSALEGLQGNDLLFGLYNEEEKLRKRIEQWKQISTRITQRAPAFQLAERLILRGKGIDGLDAHAATVEAIKANRSLLDEPDPVAPLLKEVGSTLRSALTSASRRYEEALESERSKLIAHSVWNSLPADKRKVLEPRLEANVRRQPQIGTDSELAEALETTPFSIWESETQALPARFNQLLLEAAREMEPKARRLELPSATIKDESQMEDWLKRVRTSLASAIKDGPVIV